MSLGTGATISFSSGFMASILSVEYSGLHREAIRNSNFGTTGWHTFEPADLVDPGELQVELQFAAESDPPIDSVAEAVSVTVPSAGAGGDSLWAWTEGFMTDFEFGLPFEDKQTARATVKLSGALTVTP